MKNNSGSTEKLGPGSDADTAKVLAMLPVRRFDSVVDVGCGVGRQTLVLMKTLATLVHAIDKHQPYLDLLNQRALSVGMKHLVRTHCMDMADVSDEFPEIDLLWAECAAYNIGFPNALNLWHSAIKSDGYAVVSELTWLRNEAQADVRQHFDSSYPDMRTLEQNIEIAQNAGYVVVATHVLSREAWIDGYYDRLEPLARSFLSHPEKAVRDFATQTIEGIRMFNRADGSCNYVFYVMKKSNADCSQV